MFQVQITEVGKKEEVVKEWQKLREPKDTEDNNYGYVQTKTEVEDNKVIFFQEVEDLNLVNVIGAINEVPTTVIKQEKK